MHNPAKPIQSDSITNIGPRHVTCPVSGVQASLLHLNVNRQKVTLTQLCYTQYTRTIAAGHTNFPLSWEHPSGWRDIDAEICQRRICIIVSWLIDRIVRICVNVSPLPWAFRVKIPESINVLQFLLLSVQSMLRILLSSNLFHHRRLTEMGNIILQLLF